FAFSDQSAKGLGGGVRDGLYRVFIRFRTVKGRPNYVFRVKAYGDFSAATEAAMITQLISGNDTAAVAAEWTPTNRGWLLRETGFFFQ
ncbi:MAG: hypothetical protein MI867_18210, partial [Pseudomonadales bacterium]|nr:hypothetical protein [Pseudomonadales bacterium]